MPMHMHKMFKKMHKRHRGPPPGMLHGMYGMWHHMMPKPHGMRHHMMPNPHEMWPPLPHKGMKPHKMHPHMFHKMHHKMHKKHHHMKHHGKHSSSSSSSSSESEDESLVEGIDNVQIGNQQQEKENPGNETPAPPNDGGYPCVEKFKCKKGKHFKSKGGHKHKALCEMMQKDAFSPQSRCWMQLSSMRERLCRDSRYNKGVFCLPPPDIEEGEVPAEHCVPEETTCQVGFQQVTGPEKSRAGGHPSRRQRPGDSVDYFMKSIAEQIKKLPEAKIAEAKLKILEVVNEMQLNTAQEQSTSAEGMNVDDEQPHEPQPETQSQPQPATQSSE